MSKSVIIINQNKGGVGKSFLASLIVGKSAKNNDNFIVVDVDSGNQSTSKRFANTEFEKHIKSFSIIEGDTIQQTTFNTLFNNLAGANVEKIYLDFGGTESREILAFFRMVGIESVSEYFKEIGLNVEFWTVINCEDSATTAHLNNTIETLKGQIPIVVFVNDQNGEGNSALLDEYKNRGLDIRHFGDIKDAKARQIISDYVISGFSSNLGMLKGLWSKQMENLKTA